MPRIREILVLHHSHLDVGYTHSQPIVWEMQREFIDQAICLLSDTSGWPEASRPKWTCEVTAPVLRWLQSAGDADIRRFRTFVREGRIGISAMQYSLSALCSAELLCRQLAPVAALRRNLGARIATAIQHDVNGVPWPLADLLLDAGIELLVMGVNIDHGRAVTPRPGVFLWSAPSGRTLPVMNGNAYTMFDQILRTWHNSLDSMRAGLTEYTAHLEEIGYPLDFLYLTTTNPPEAWDNSPPNPWVAALIRQWNESGADPPIRYVTPEDLGERIRRIPADSLPVLRGDWTDYWSFGAGSAAYETALGREASSALFLAEALPASRRAVGASDPRTARVTGLAWDALALYYEHSWTSWDPEPDKPPTRALSALKAAFAHDARELATYLLIDELESLGGNPHQSGGPGHLLVFNPSGRACTVTVTVPASWREPGKRLRVQRFAWAGQTDAAGRSCGPIDMPPFGWKRIALADIRPAASALEIAIVRHGGAGASIESPFHRLTFDGSSGRITGLTDRRLGWEVVPGGADTGFFDPVWERPDPGFDGTRSAIYERDLEKEKLDRSCWKTDWKAERKGCERAISCTAKRDERSVSLVRELALPGLDTLRQTITLRADSDAVELEAVLRVPDRADPQALYFAFPLNLPPGWRRGGDPGRRG